MYKLKERRSMDEKREMGGLSSQFGVRLAWLVEELGRVVVCEANGTWFALGGSK